MRPLKLRMSAFGSYAGEIVIPMEKLGERGLYLITGDTGAGKTTIFDAICYALFGEASGVNREVSMLRSKYAQPGTPTEVELEFLHGGKVYTVKRTPEYMRPNKKGEGMTKQLAVAQLKKPDGQVVTKVKEVTAEIENILGMNKHQFSQISMLAQGEFLKLLLAKTDERQKIFRELFNTEYYQKLQQELAGKASAADRVCAAMQASIRQHVLDIAVDEDNVLYMELDKAKAGKLAMEEILTLLDSLLEEDKTSLERCEKERTTLGKELETTDKVLGVAAEIEKSKRALEELENKLARELPVLKDTEEKLSIARESLKGKDELQKRAAAIEAELPNYDALDNLQKEIDGIDKEHAEKAKRLEETQTEETARADKIAGLKKELELLQDAGAMKERLLSEEKTLRQSADSYQEMEQKLLAMHKKQEEFERAQERRVSDEEGLSHLVHEYELLDRALRDGQAGLLAAALEEGSPCPVCGSRSHPRKAQLTDAVPTKEVVDRAKDKAEKAREIAGESSHRVGLLHGELDSMERDVKELLKKYLNSEKLEQADVLLSKRQIQVRKQLEELSEKLSVEQTRLARKYVVEREIPVLEAEWRKLTSEKVALREACSSFRASMKEKSMQMESLSGKLMFHSKSEASAQINELQSSAKALQDAYDRARAELDGKSQSVAKLSGQIDGYRKSLAMAQLIDVESETKKREKLSSRMEEILQCIKEIDARKRNNQKVEENVKMKSDELVEAEKRRQWITTLSDSANGKLRGKEKIMLETYIQTTYFDRIIARANLRFRKMSDNQYELKREQEASNSKSQSGLELCVIENGTKRSVKSLSGGESFMASLSLALGFSDEVQSSSGGIQVDTMFVDEGFGSLDSESLNMVYQALVSMTEGNRLVGIISHVSDLKYKIDRQLVVTKQKSGGSTVRMEI